MKGLIERGFLYIAQPPLFKVKKGKSERYIKDEASLENHLLELALAGAQVRLRAGAPALPSDAVRRLLDGASQYRRVLEKLALRRLDDRVAEAVVWCGAPTEADLRDAQALTARVAPLLNERLLPGQKSGDSISFTTEPDPEHGCHRLVCETRRAGVVFRTLLDIDFLRSPDFERLRDLAAQMRQVGAGPFLVGADDGEAVSVATPIGLLEHLLALGEKGLTIQRYKGLGEMNPDQLADTTMNPATRTLLQVQALDDVEADDAFTTLMGDDVEPRRDFIERNALDVKNLDI
jgi:DNA gyrase subunit B